MSFEALAAVPDAAVTSPTALLLLYILAQYADEDGVCYPSQATLAEDSHLSIRAVRDNLSMLAETGVIACERRQRKDGTRTSNRVTLRYYTPRKVLKNRPAPPAAAAGGEAAEGAEKASDHRQQLPVVQRQLTPGLPAAAAGPTTFEPVREPIGCSDKSSHPERGRVGEEGFGEGWAAYPATGRLGVSSERQAKAAWVAEVEDGAEPQALIAGCRAYAADPSLWGSSGKPKAFHNFLKTGVWADLAAAAVAAGVEAVWPGPPETRTAFVAVLGEDRAAACLDRAGWREADATLLARTSWAANILQTEGAAVVASLGLRIEISKTVGAK